MTNRQIAYRRFLSGDEWKAISDQKKSEVPCCEECGSADQLQSHHIRYPKRWEDTVMADLKVLCRTCHRIEHGLPVASPFDFEFKKLQLKVNQSTSSSDLPKLRDLRMAANKVVLEWDRYELEGLIRLIAISRIKSNPGTRRMRDWSKSFYDQLTN
jgi:hypothetical protein